MLMLVITVLAVAIINYAGTDRIAAARMGVQGRGLACADAGIQYGRRYFGCNYKATGGWNTILSGGVTGRYDPSLGDASPATLAALDRRLRGDANNDGSLDPGTDLDGDGVSDFWVSIRDDDDEQPLGAADDRRRDNNLAVYLRSECTNPAFMAELGGEPRTATVEVLLVYVPGSTSPYGKATSSSDFPEASASGPTVVTTLSTCD
jgi:hypothetical protein